MSVGRLCFQYFCLSTEGGGWSGVRSGARSGGGALVQGSPGPVSGLVGGSPSPRSGGGGGALHVGDPPAQKK